MGAAAMSTPLFPVEGDSVIVFAAHSVACPLCGATPLDAYHLISECNHVIIDGWREKAESAARVLLVSLADVIERERERAGYERDSLLPDRVRRAITRLDFDSPEGDFLLYRLLVAHPWSERMACPGMPVVRLLGNAFDRPGVFHRFERPVLDMWSRWSVRWLWELSRAWRVTRGIDV
jgi:hypothetical protein